MGGHQGQQGQAHYCLGTMQGKLRTRIRIMRTRTHSQHGPRFRHAAEEIDTMQNTKHNRIRNAESCQKHTKVFGLCWGNHSANTSRRIPRRHQDPNYKLAKSKDLRAKIRTKLGKLRSQIHAMTRAMVI
jgi:non-ribosomal peptide synthetase component E (peptide arylation enzyme)